MRKFALVCLLAATALGGCMETPKRLKVPVAKDAAQLGAVNVAVTSTAAWEDVAADFETDFKLSNEDALAKAIPTTTSVSDKLVDLMSLALSAEFAGKLKDSKVTTTTAADGTTSSEGTSTTTQKTPETPDSPEAALKLGDARGIANHQPPVAGINAFTQFRAAAALKQELAALNGSISNAASRDGYRPMLVRVQIGVQPRMRKQPFDLRLRMSFLPRLQKAGDGNNPDTSLPIVLPLLVTDSFDVTQEQISTEKLRQIAILLGARGGGLAAKLGLAKGYDWQIDTFSARINSRFTVGVDNENTLLVRIGAAQFGNELEMVPQSINATVLLLVPDEHADDMIDIILRPSFNNAHTGKTLPLSSNNKDGLPGVNKEVRKLYCGNNSNKPECTEEFRHLATLTRDGSSFGAFREKALQLKAVTCRNFSEADRQKDVCIHDLWAEAQRAAEGLWVSNRASFHAINHQKHELPIDQLAAVRKDEDTLIASLASKDPGLAKVVSASLVPNMLPTGKDCASWPGNKTGIMAFDQSSNKSVISFTFPATQSDYDKGSLILRMEKPKKEDGKSEIEIRCYNLAWAEEAKEQPSAAATLGTGATSLRLDNGRGKVLISVGWNDEASGAVLRAENALIVGGTGLTIKDDKFEGKVTAKGKVSLLLEQIADRGVVTIYAIPLGKDGKEVPGGKTALRFDITNPRSGKESQEGT